MNVFTLFGSSLEINHDVSASQLSLGHVMFSFGGTVQETGAGGRSGAAGIAVCGSLSRAVFLCSFTFLLAHCGCLVSTLVLSSETEWHFFYLMTRKWLYN